MCEQKSVYLRKLLRQSALVAAVVATLFATSAMATGSMCSTVFSETQVDLDSSPALSELRTYIESQKLVKHPHSLEMTPEGVTLQIGHLKRDQKKFMVLAYRAIEEGSLKKIDGGNVVGPKVFPSILSLAKAAIKNSQDLVITGRFDPDRIRDNFNAQVNLKNNEGAYRWSANEIRAFEESMVELEVHRCTSMICRFTYTTLNGELKVEYEPIRSFF